MEMLEATHRLLLQEVEDDTTGEAESPRLAEDRRRCVCCWNPTSGRPGRRSYLLTSKSIPRKINPMLGKIV